MTRLAVVAALATLAIPALAHAQSAPAAAAGEPAPPTGARYSEATALVTGAMIAFSDCGLFAPQPCEASPVGPTIAFLGVAAYAAGTIDDILSAPGRAARLNREAATLSLAPQVAPGRAGVAVVGTF